MLGTVYLVLYNSALCIGWYVRARPRTALCPERGSCRRAARCVSGCLLALRGFASCARPSHARCVRQGPEAASARRGAGRRRPRARRQAARGPFQAAAARLRLRAMASVALRRGGVDASLPRIAAAGGGHARRVRCARRDKSAQDVGCRTRRERLGWPGTSVRICVSGRGHCRLIAMALLRSTHVTQPQSWGAGSKALPRRRDGAGRGCAISATLAALHAAAAPPWGRGLALERSDRDAYRWPGTAAGAREGEHVLLSAVGSRVLKCTLRRVLLSRR